MSSSVSHQSLSFKEQIEFFKGKLKLPSPIFERLNDEAKSKAFSSAGAIKQELVNDLHGAVLSAMKEGQTLAQFKKSFDGISQKHGWGYKGSSDFKARIIYQTNLRQSYNAGRWQQHLKTQEERPFLEYVHSGSSHPRRTHLDWNGVIKPMDDPWWDSHYPQNGFGCKCKTFSHSKGSLQKKGLKVTDKAPFEGEIVENINPTTGEIQTTPKGIDPGFQNNIGKLGYGDAYGEALRKALNTEGKKGFTTLNPTTAQDLGMDALRSSQSRIKPLGTPATNQKALSQIIEKTTGGKIATLSLGGLHEPVYINSEQLASHLSKDLSRSIYIPYLKELIEKPQEIWASFEKSKLTGKVHLRKRIIQRIHLEGQKDKGVLLVLEEHKGHWVGVTFIPTSGEKAMEKKRYGVLLFKQ